MPQIMAEAFARGLIDKIMVEVLDVIDRDTQDEKSWERRVDVETARSELAQGISHERTHVNYSKTEEMELIAMIVRDLRDIQIGDSRYVLPPSLLALEKQVKYASCNVDDASLESSADVIETRTTQGQGDTHQIIHTAILESPAEPTKPAKAACEEKENETANEASSISVGLLHQLIEELKSKTSSICSQEDGAPGSTSKERIAVWEEKEEQLVRTIEDTGDMLATMTGTLRGTESIGCFRDVEPKYDELRSHSSQHMASSSRETRLEEAKIAKHKSSLPSSSKSSRQDAAMSAEEILPVDKSKTSRKEKAGEATTTKKKRGLGSALRRLFRATFGRRKN